MVKFDLQKAKEGKKVCTISGKKAEIVKFDLKNELYPLLVVITTEHAEEVAYLYTIDGKLHWRCNCDDDLVMVCEEHKGFINILKDKRNSRWVDSQIYDTEEEAHQVTNQVATLEITWTE